MKRVRLDRANAMDTLSPIHSELFVVFIEMTPPTGDLA